jgi:menaquinone-dependent protoporphyrinogen IX oxidase
MKRVASSMGASPDTSRDHEYTDWAALDRLVDQMAQEISVPVGSTASQGSGIR